MNIELHGLVNDSRLVEDVLTCLCRELKKEFAERASEYVVTHVPDKTYNIDGKRDLFIRAYSDNAGDFEALRDVFSRVKIPGGEEKPLFIECVLVHRLIGV